MPPENWHILKIDAWKTTSPFKMVPLKRGRLHEFSRKIPQKEGNPTSTHFSTQIHKLQGPGFRNMAIFLQPSQPLTNPQPTPNQPQDFVSRRRPVEWSHPLLWARHRDVGLKGWPERLVGLDVWMDSYPRLSLYRTSPYPLGSPNISDCLEKILPFWKIGHTSSKGWFMFQPC